MVQEQATVALRDKADSSSLKAQNYYSDQAPRHAVYAPEADELGLTLQALQTARDEADLHFTLRVIEDDLPWRCENIPDIHQDVAWIQERRSYLQQVGMTVGELLLAAPLPRHQA